MLAVNARYNVTTSVPWFRAGRFVCLALFLLLVPVSTARTQNKALPLITRSVPDNDRPMVFHITGDGGWKMFDVKLGKAYHANNFSFIVLNAFRYFWAKRTPDQLAADMAPVIADSMKQWHKQKLILTGYSFGAETVPFLYNRLPGDLRSKVILVVLLTPAGTSDFTIHIRDMLGMESRYRYDVAGEVSRIHGVPVLCVYGEKEKPGLTEKNTSADVIFRCMPGGHHFTDAPDICKMIAGFAGIQDVQPRNP